LSSNTKEDGAAWRIFSKSWFIVSKSAFLLENFGWRPSLCIQARFAVAGKEGCRTAFAEPMGKCRVENVRQCCVDHRISEHAGRGNVKPLRHKGSAR
jgi:hypothetical protein